MLTKLNLNKKDKYILGCSSGPDSMALFFLLLKEKYDFVVCNIDYNYRDNSIEETNLVRKYCNDNNIPFYTKNVLFQDIYGNFEAWARKIRYDYFEEIGNKLNIKNVLIAHNMDDLIETYLMQKERKTILDYYGLHEIYKRNDMVIIRPLLSFTKSQLKNICVNNNIKFILDPTNNDITLKRNYIRHKILPFYSYDEKVKMVEKIKKLNIKIENEIEYVKSLMCDKLSISIDNYTKLNTLQKNYLFHLLLKHTSTHFNISNGIINEINSSIENSNFKYKCLINDDYISLDNNLVSLVIKNVKYKYEFNSNFVKCGPFLINYDELFKNNKITFGMIRPLQEIKTIKINNYVKKVNRLFIDWKLPHYLRPFWPAIYDENGKFIYTPRYRKEFLKKNSNILNFDIHEVINELIL